MGDEASRGALSRVFFPASYLIVLLAHISTIIFLLTFLIINYSYWMALAAVIPLLTISPVGLLSLIIGSYSPFQLKWILLGQYFITLGHVFIILISAAVILSMDSLFTIPRVFVVVFGLSALFHAGYIILIAGILSSDNPRHSRVIEELTNDDTSGDVTKYCPTEPDLTAGGNLTPHRYAGSPYATDISIGTPNATPRESTPRRHPFAIE